MFFSVPICVYLFFLTVFSLHPLLHSLLLFNEMSSLIRCNEFILNGTIRNKFGSWQYGASHLYKNTTVTMYSCYFSILDVGWWVENRFYTESISIKKGRVCYFYRCIVFWLWLFVDNTVFIFCFYQFIWVYLMSLYIYTLYQKRQHIFQMMCASACSFVYYFDDCLKICVSA